MTEMPEQSEYANGLCEKPHGKGGWSDHLGFVDHYYGPFDSLASVRTACGRHGRMYRRQNAATLPNRLGATPCKTCQKRLNALAKENKT
ncbi:hypothetical protein LCGC14_2334580 [marine sediment metagenome]|uniref:Uncharacterized protein n=1 Tax=marine sediment metagenome TaxID=412755 RepID=A0A0F9D1A8_9ZZZZ